MLVAWWLHWACSARSSILREAASRGLSALAYIPTCWLTPAAYGATVEFLGDLWQKETSCPRAIVWRCSHDPRFGRFDIGYNTGRDRQTDRQTHDDVIYRVVHRRSIRSIEMMKMFLSTSYVDWGFSTAQFNEHVHVTIRSRSPFYPFLWCSTKQFALCHVTAWLSVSMTWPL